MNAKKPALNKRKNESGNVLFYILIAVALIAALSFAVSSSDRGSMGQIDNERARLLSSEMLEYSSNVATAVNQLKLRGCSDTQISFQNATSTADYTNTGNPTGDNTCHVFHISGAGLQFRDAPVGASDLAESILFDGNMEIENIGMTAGDASSSELLLIYRDIGQNVCEAINDLLGLSSLSPTDTALDFVAFQGTYAYANTIGDEDAALDGMRAGCVQETTGSTYNFYRVLIAR
ncbi:MAG: hypothetical protein ACLFR0_07070 [Alphaproteobacteria bacterium]